MSRAAAWTRVSAFLFAAAGFGTPLHLAVEAHAWHHDAEPDDHRHDTDPESNHEPHPAADHELTATDKAPRLVLAPVAVVPLHILVVPPFPRTWVPAVEADAHSPPDAVPTPPRSPRAPPA